MSSFFDNMPLEHADRIEQASRLSFELRESHTALLHRYGAKDKTEVLERIISRAEPEHPAWDHYLSLGILASTRDALRTELSQYLAEVQSTRRSTQAEDAPPVEPGHHVDLKTRIEDRYGDRLAGEPQFAQDALIVRFDDGLALELRVASPQDYSFHWVWGEAELRIDTAPLHRDLATFPNHLHDVEGKRRADPVTKPGLAPWENVQALIDALQANPLLEGI